MLFTVDIVIILSANFYYTVFLFRYSGIILAVSAPIVAASVKKVITVCGPIITCCKLTAGSNINIECFAFLISKLLNTCVCLLFTVDVIIIITVNFDNAVINFSVNGINQLTTLIKEVFAGNNTVTVNL